MKTGAIRDSRKSAASNDMSIKQQLCIALYQTAHRTSRLYGRLLAPHGLTFPQFQVLLALQDLRECTVGTLCTTLDLDTSTITAVLKRLEAQDFIHRFRDRVDERRVFVHLTEKGLAFEADARRIRSSYTERTGLSEAEMSALHRALQKLSAAIEPALA